MRSSSLSGSQQRLRLYKTLSTEGGGRVAWTEGSTAAERREAARMEVWEREEAQKERDGDDDLRPLMRHALKLYIFIGWAMIVLSALGIIAGLILLANQL